MQKLTNKKVNLHKIELIYATIYILAGKILDTFAEEGVAMLSMGFLLLIFTVLVVVFFRQHAYGHDKPLLTALSVYYKTMAYSVVIFTLFNLPFRVYILGATMVSIILYMFLSYFFGKKYNEMLNAYLYLCLTGFA